MKAKLAVALYDKTVLRKSAKSMDSISELQCPHFFREISFVLSLILSFPPQLGQRKIATIPPSFTCWSGEFRFGVDSKERACATSCASSHLNASKFKIILLCLCKKNLWIFT